MNVVPACAATTASSASINRSNRGKRGSAKDHSGWTSSSSRRSLRSSTGSKNATGSATWITIGSPSSPAVSHTSESRPSSGSSGSPRSSWSASPRSFHTLMPSGARVRRRTEVAGDAVGPVLLGEPGPIEMAERREAAGVRVVVPVEVRPELVSPSAVEVHDRVDVARCHVAEQRADVRRRPAAVGRQPPAEVVVRVDRGEPGARHVVPRQPRRGPRPVRVEGKLAQRRIERSGLQSGRSHGVTPW